MMRYKKMKILTRIMIIIVLLTRTVFAAENMEVIEDFKNVEVIEDFENVEVDHLHSDLMQFREYMSDLDIELIKQNDPDYYKILEANEVNNIFRISALFKYSNNKGKDMDYITQKKNSIMHEIKRFKYKRVFDASLSNPIRTGDILDCTDDTQNINYNLLEDILDLLSMLDYYNAIKNTDILDLQNEDYNGNYNIEDSKNLYKTVFFHLVLNTDVITRKYNKRNMDIVLMNLGKIIDKILDSGNFELANKIFNHNDDSMETDKITIIVNSVLNRPLYEYSRRHICYKYSNMLIDNILDAESMIPSFYYNTEFMSYLHPIVRLCIKYNLDIKIVANGSKTSEFRTDALKLQIPDSLATFPDEILDIEISDANVQEGKFHYIIPVNSIHALINCKELYIDVSQNNQKYIKKFEKLLVNNPNIYILQNNGKDLLDYNNNTKITKEDSMALIEKSRLKGLSSDDILLNEDITITAIIYNYIIWVSGFKLYSGFYMAICFTILGLLKQVKQDLYNGSRCVMYFFNSIIISIILDCFVNLVPLFTEVSNEFKYIHECRIIYGVLMAISMIGLSLCLFNQKLFFTRTIAAQKTRKIIRNVFFSIFLLLLAIVTATVLFGDKDILMALLYTKAPETLGVLYFIAAFTIVRVDSDVLVFSDFIKLPKIAFNKICRMFNEGSFTSQAIPYIIILTGYILIPVYICLFIRLECIIPYENMLPYVKYTFSKGAPLISA
ncbi:hypothetical protein NEPAR06_0676 [Nematocida parisii]|nr:hypothetical protein NEPAR07_0469 [Nematocida parisii]KAI5153718.1 hypothetical protein NEPAR06_0676 [Nematocida parisii]KAI5156169.1 hypothetical protein NEPAR05_0346 [Nematocida parisii]